MDGSRRRRPGAEPALSGWSVALLAVVLVVYGNVIAFPLLPEWVVLFTNLAVGLTVVLAMRAFRYSLAEIGLSKEGWHRGWTWGVLVSAVVVAVVAIAAGPADRFTAVPGMQGMTLGVLGWQVLIRIPIGTALFEETVFRGVLYAAWHRVMRSWQAACLSSAAFAFWHVVVEMRRQERQAHALCAGGYVNIVLVLSFLFVVGMLLCWLREKTAGVIAPTIVHWATNSSAAIAIYFVSN